MDGMVNVIEPELPSGWKFASLDDPLERAQFDNWIVEFEHRAAGAETLKSLEKTLGKIHSGGFQQFRREVLYACFGAWRYDQYPLKPSTHNPEASRQRLEAAEDYLAYFKLIHRRAGRGNVQINVLKDALDRIPDWPYKCPEAFLEELVRQLQTERDLADTAITTGRRWVACLSYGREVSQNQFPENEAEYGLRIYLDWLIRRWTRSDGGDPLDFGNGVVHSDYGTEDRPRRYYKIIARLAAATLRNEVLPTDKEAEAAEQVGNAVRKVRRNYPDATITEWPVSTEEQATSSADANAKLP